MTRIESPVARRRVLKSSNLIMGSENVAPEHGHIGAGRLDSLSVSDRAELLVSLFPHEAPPRVNVGDNQSDVNRAVWTLLNEIDNDPQMLSVSQMLTLSKAEWFKDFFTNAMLRANRKIKEISFSDMVYLLTQVCPEEPPSSDTQRAFVEDRHGRRVFFEPSRALESLAKFWEKEDGPSAEDKKLLATLPWGSTWISSACPGKSSKQSKSNARLVTKEAKLMMMRIFYPYKAPTWREEHPVRVGEDSVWIFKPVQWVDDVSNMWLGGELRVRLAQEEMTTLEQLPWFLPLIEQKRAKRKSRYMKGSEEPENNKFMKTTDYEKAVPVVLEKEEDDCSYNEEAWESDYASAGAGAEVHNESQELV
jgi:hypothetical protein